MEADSSPERVLPTLLPTASKEARDEGKSGIKAEDELPTPNAGSLERWDDPRINTWRFLATLWGFWMMGANDGAFGV